MSYFPNKVHQQIVNEPFKVLELDGSYDVLVRVHGGGPAARPARCASASPAR
jgi:small subunit ribosomal protein S9